VVVGLPRPEEVAFKIASGQITSGPPAALVEEIKALNLTNATSFTAYPEGPRLTPGLLCTPREVLASSAALVVLDLTPKQLCQIKLTDWAVSYARTVAGVHYVTDNIAGLESWSRNCSPAFA
jgi:CBS domain containing-hemolysin-like protein